MGEYRKLLVWERAHTITVRIYTVTRHWPADEQYGLTSQIRRAAASIGCNLAEGCGRNSSAELARFARVALGSANEVEYQLQLAHDLGYMKAGLFDSLVSEISQIRRMLAALARQLSSTRIPARPLIADS